MNFDLSPDQQAVADLATQLFSDGAPPDALWRQLAESRLLDLLVPEDKGGVGLGFVELALVLTAQGAALAPVPLWRHALGALAVAAGGDPMLLPRLADGSALITLSLEGRLRALPSGDGGWRLSGHVAALPQAGRAASAVLAAPEGLFLVDLQGPGIKQAPGRLTHDEPAADLHLDGLYLPPRARLQGLDAGWLRARAALCLAALQVGVADGALRQTAQHVSTRHQFGRPLGSFQAVAQRAADGFTDIEVARTLATELAWRLDAGRPLGSAVEIALYWANQCSHRVAHTAMHLHGGLGADTSYPIHRRLLWARALEVELGGAQRQLARIGDTLGNTP